MNDCFGYRDGANCLGSEYPESRNVAARLCLQKNAFMYIVRNAQKSESKEPKSRAL